MVFVEPKGKKEGTRGQKQIAQENKETVKYYTLMAATTCGIRVASLLVTGMEGFLLNSLLGFTIFIQIACLTLMTSMSKCVYGERGQLLDAGMDLNIKNGNAEYLKDFIILTSSLQVLVILSSYFWWLLLVVPVYAFYLLWVNILGPWFFAPGSAQEELSEKKQRKLDRKMRRMQAR